MSSCKTEKDASCASGTCSTHSAEAKCKTEASCKAEAVCKTSK